MFRGSIVALVTPMLGNGDVDYEQLEALVEFHLREGTEALVIAGTTGESATLSPAEHCELLQRSYEIIDRRLPMIAGTGANSTAEAIYGLGLEGNCTFCNPACVRLLGYADDDELLGRNMYELIHHTRADGSPSSASARPPPGWALPRKTCSGRTWDPGWWWTPPTPHRSAGCLAWWPAIPSRTRGA